MTKDDRPFAVMFGIVDECREVRFGVGQGARFHVTIMTKYLLPTIRGPIRRHAA